MEQIGGNIDPKTRHQLVCINQECIEAVYRKLHRGLLKTEIDDSRMQQALSIMNSSKTPQEAKMKLKQLIAKGAFDPEVTKTIDKVFEREMDECLTYKINQAIRSGRMLPPGKAIKADEFSRKMAQRMK